MKIWYFASLLFFILSLFTLIEDRYEVTYESIENKTRNRTELIDTVVCIPLEQIEIYSNRSEIDLNLLKDELYEYLNGSKSRIKIKYQIKIFEDLVLNGIKGNNYLITRDQLCFSKINKYDQNNFIYFKNILKNQRHFAINWDTFYMAENFIISNTLIVLNKEYPYSNCTENYSKFKCLNKCFKKKNRLSKYWYSADETGGVIKLNYDNNNQTLKKNEDECFKECKKEDCKLVYISPIFKLSSDFKFIEARPLIPPFDYCAQLIGLFVLFTNICFCQIYVLLINKINLIVKKQKHRRYVTIARYTTLILVGFGFLASFIIKIIEFENQQFNPVRRETTYRSIEQNSFSIVFCIKAINNIDKNVTLSTLDQETSKVFNESFKGIYLDFENKRKRVDFTLNSKVIFICYFDYFSRCFHLVLHLKEIRYQSLFSSSKLIVEFKHEFYTLYLIPDDQNFNSKSYESGRSYNYIKKITTRSKLKNCVDYRKIYSNFRNRWDSVDRCISRKYINRTGKVLVISKSYRLNSIIDQDHYTEDEWKSSYIEWNETVYYKIKEECEKENKEEDCYKIEFIDSTLITPQDNFKTVNMELYVQINLISDEDPSFYKVLLDILNILSILFGLSVFQLLHLIYLLIKIKFKWCLLLIYLLCSIGLTYHIYYILNKVLNEDLIYNQHYEVLKSYKMAENIFCFEFNQTLIDKNYELTGNYLNEITNEMKAETVFNNISYLSKSNEWISLESKSNYTTDEFKIETFFFVNKKCFKLKQEIEYDWKQFYFENQKNEVLKIYFNRSFIHQDQRVTHLMSRVENTIQFIKIDLNFKTRYIKFACLIYQEPFELTHDDKFNFIKNPLSLFYGENDVNDPDRYLKRLIDFKRGLSTLNLPLEEDAFNNEIDDDLFEQYYLQIQNVTDHQTPAKSNYKRIFATNYYNVDSDTSKPDLSLHLIPFKKKLTITNSDNFTKLILNLLNAFSTWFGLGVFDLHVYVHLLFDKIKSILIFTYWLILDFERFILIRL